MKKISDTEKIRSQVLQNENIFEYYLQRFQSKSQEISLFSPAGSSAQRHRLPQLP